MKLCVATVVFSNDISLAYKFELLLRATMPVFLKNSAARVLLVFATTLYGCSDNSPSNNECDYLDGFYDGVQDFHVQWKTSDSLQFFYGFVPYNPTGGEKLRYSGYHHVHLLVSETPDGPWRAVLDTLNRNITSTADYLFFTVLKDSDELRFYRLDVKYDCSDEIFQGLIVATTKPTFHPSEWEMGPELNTGVSDQSASTACFSSDGTKLFMSHRQGRIFDMANGQDITPPQLDSLFDVNGYYMPWRWLGGKLYRTGITFAEYDLTTFQWVTLSSSGGFSTFKDDTSIIIQKGPTGNYLAQSYNIVTGDIYQTPTLPIANLPSESRPNTATSSITYKYFAVKSMYFNVQLAAESWHLLDASFHPIRVIHPFPNYRPHPFSWSSGGALHKLYMYVQWANDDDIAYLWASWSGNPEIWAYSISKNKYWQITGYTNEQYPGFYTDRTYKVIGTTNFIYSQQKNKLMLFFAKDNFSYNTRYVSLPQ